MKKVFSICNWFVLIIFCMLSFGCVKDIIQNQPVDNQDIEQFSSQVRPLGEYSRYYQRGSHFQGIKKYHLAVDQFQKVIAIVPDHFQAYNAIGISYDMMGEYSQAREWYKKALAMNPELDYVLNNLGYSYIMEYRFEDAIEYLKRAVVLNDQSARYHNNLGVAYAMVWRTEEALAEFEKATGDENLAHARLVQSRIEYRRGQDREYQSSSPKVRETEQVPEPEQPTSLEPKADTPVLLELKQLPGLKPVRVVELEPVNAVPVAKADEPVVQSQKSPAIDNQADAAKPVAKVSPEPVNAPDTDVEALSRNAYKMELIFIDGFQAYMWQLTKELTRAGYHVSFVQGISKDYELTCVTFHGQEKVDHAVDVEKRIPGKQCIRTISRFGRPGVGIQVVFASDMLPAVSEISIAKQSDEAEKGVN